ncbi:MAG: hypothetical protein JW744_04840 [Candidatus Diapherotrites archaeon]|uniref:PKD domain-containing protein n=1 Tax=Candidatus Iainarchaeum sp. TaxID=3101447 RepID=A0A938YV93_9ARCH|nr:hypothetical protein [Candidatus Diapherotrites archaeon]
MLDKRLVLTIAIALLLIGEAGAVFYGLCDRASIERSTLRCEINQPKPSFTQNTVDLFWESVQADQNYLDGSIDAMLWAIRGTVVNVTQDTSLVEPSYIDMPWDLEISGDANLLYDVYWDMNSYTQTEGTHTGIKTTTIGLSRPLLTIAPVAGKRSVRNITIENDEGFVTYLTGDLRRKMKLEIEGNLSISGSSLENAEYVKARNITMADSAIMKNIGSIEARNISLSHRSEINNIGELGEKSIQLKDCTTGLELDIDSGIENLLGGISVEGNITISGNSRIKTLQHITENVIESIDAISLSISGSSEISGVGGQPGTIVLQDRLSLDQNSSISGRKGNSIKRVEAGSLYMAQDSWMWNIENLLRVGGGEEFTMLSGSKVLSLRGNAESCAEIEMQGSGTKIMFTEDSERQMTAPAINLSDGATIICLGETECDYEFVEKVCGNNPVADLNTIGKTKGYAPLNALFTGSCSDTEGIESCTIVYGDNSSPEEFIGTAVHTYLQEGEYTARLTAVDTQGNEAAAELTISALENPAGPVAPPDGTGVEPELELSVFPDTVKQGEILFVLINLNTEAESITLTNDAGLDTVASSPAGFPARVGPFRVSKTTSPGRYQFTLIGTTAAGKEFSGSAMFNVTEREGTVFGVDLFVIISIGFVAVLLVIAIIAVKLIKAGKLKLKMKKKEPPEKKAVEAMTKENPLADIMPLDELKEHELPPWLREKKKEEEFK